MEWFRDELVFKAHRLCILPNSRLESNTEEEEVERGPGHLGLEEELEGIVEHDHPAPSLQSLGFRV